MNAIDRAIKRLTHDLNTRPRARDQVRVVELMKEREELWRETGRLYKTIEPAGQEPGPGSCLVPMGPDDYIKNGWIMDEGRKVIRIR